MINFIRRLVALQREVEDLTVRLGKSQMVTNPPGLLVRTRGGDTTSAGYVDGFAGLDPRTDSIVWLLFWNTGSFDVYGKVNDDSPKLSQSFPMTEEGVKDAVLHLERSAYGFHTTDRIPGFQRSAKALWALGPEAASLAFQVEKEKKRLAAYRPAPYRPY